jgi:hypothetical protein
LYRYTSTRLQSGKQGRDFTGDEETEILAHVNELPCFNQLPRHVAISLIQNSLCVEYVPGESLCYQVGGCVQVTFSCDPQLVKAPGFSNP